MVDSSAGDPGIVAVAVARLLLPGDLISNGLFSFVQIFSRETVLWAPNTASAVSGRKSQEGLDLLPLLTHQQAAENVPKDIFAILLTP